MRISTWLLLQQKDKNSRLMRGAMITKLKVAHANGGQQLSLPPISSLISCKILWGLLRHPGTLFGCVEAISSTP
jgi:hypothetical protein